MAFRGQWISSNRRIFTGESLTWNQKIDLLRNGSACFSYNTFIVPQEYFDSAAIRMREGVGPSNRVEVGEDAAPEQVWVT
jgi:hypothetical protein